MICRGVPSSIRVRPIAAVSAPNFARQYPAVNTTVSGLAGVPSARENTRPSIGCAPRIDNTPSVTNSVRTSSGSPTPLTLTVPVFQRPTSWNTRPSSR